MERKLKHASMCAVTSVMAPDATTLARHRIRTRDAIDDGPNSSQLHVEPRAKSFCKYCEPMCPMCGTGEAHADPHAWNVCITAPSIEFARVALTAVNPTAYCVD